MLDATVKFPKRIMHYLLLIALAYGALVLLLIWREPKMIFYPSREIALTPDKVGWPYEDVWLTTADGARINGWFLPAPPSPHSSLITLLFLHGNAGNISHRLEKLAILQELGTDVFIIDYRGYGRSEGTPNEPGTYADARTAYEYLAKQRGVDPQRIVVYGESLGAAVAVQLATESPVAGVVLEEAFTSAGDMGQQMFPFLPVRRLVRNKYDSLSKIARINAPLMLFHSRSDELIPYHHAERLLAAAIEPKKLVALRGSHNDAFLISADLYRHELAAFLPKKNKKSN